MLFIVFQGTLLQILKNDQGVNFMSLTFDLLINACIAFSGFYVIARILQLKRARLFTKIFSGVLGGVLGYLLMELTIPLENSVILDLRHLPVLLFAIYGLHLPLLISTVIIASMRFVFGITDAAVVAFTGMMLLGFLLYQAVKLMKKYNIPWWIKIGILNVIALLVSVGVLIINLYNHPMLWKVLPVFVLVALIAGLICSVMTADLIALHDLQALHEQSSNTDFLTGIGNTRFWDGKLNIVQRKGIKQSIGVMLFDIDHFKSVNDIHGHDNGDNILREFARILNEHTENGDVLARIGGEEFVMLVQDKSLTQVEEQAEAIRKAVESHKFLLKGGSSLFITVSIGVHYERAGNSKLNINDAKFKADKAMYEAKNSGRNRVRISTTQKERRIQ